MYVCVYIYVYISSSSSSSYYYIYTRILYASMGIYLYTCVAALVCPEFIAVGIESCNTWKYCLKVLLWSLQMQNTLFRKVPFFLGSISLGRGIRCGILHKPVVLHQLSEGTPGYFCISYISCRQRSVMTFLTSRYFARAFTHAPPWKVSRLCMMQRIWAMCRSFVCCWSLACAWISGSNWQHLTTLIYIMIQDALL